MFQFVKTWGGRKRLRTFLDTNPRGLLTFNDFVEVIKLSQYDCVDLVIEQVRNEKLFQYVKVHDTIYNSILDIPEYFTNIDEVSIVYSMNKINQEGK